MRLRSSVLRDIYNVLGKTRLHIDVLDFDIDNKEKGIFISYKHQPGIYLEFHFNNKEDEYIEKEEISSHLGMKSVRKDVKKKDYYITGKMSPGSLTEEEEFEFYGVNELHHKIESWVTNIWEDLSANPILRSVNEQRILLEKFINEFDFRHVENGDEHFSQQEVVEIKERLKDLEKRMGDELKSIIEDKEKLKTELNELKREFDTFKQTIPNLTKKNWMKSTLSKLYLWGAKKENQKLIKATATYGKILIEKAKEHI